jgi:hypothetical protein
MTGQTAVLTLAAVVLILTLAECVRRMLSPRPSGQDHPAFFFLIVSGAILVLRWPEIRFPGGINLDEAQMLAQAMRFCSHPVPWRDVDGTTSGPLNSMVLCLPMYLGAPAGWPTSRLVLWLANCLTLVFLYLALRNFGTRREAQFVLVPAILFYAFSLDPNYAHYSSETLPVLLLSAGLYLLAREWNAGSPSILRLFLLGLLCGSLPFTKLQAGPLGLFLFAAALGMLFLRRRALGPAGASLCVGLVVPEALILGWVSAMGAFHDFWISYVLASGSYAQELSTHERLHNVWMLFMHPSDFTPYLLCTFAMLIILLAAFLSRKARLEKRLLWPLFLMIADVVLTALCIATAGKAFLHYLLLLVPALAVFQGLAFFASKQLLGTNPEAASGWPHPARWFLAASMLAVMLPVLQPVRYVRDVAADYPAKDSLQIAAITLPVRAATRPGDTMAIWGWMPSYYIETGLAPATRDVIGHYVITDGPYREFFQKRYLADLKQSRPAVFIDAISDGAYIWWSWKRADAHEGFPELAAYVDANYTLWWSVQLAERGVPVRIYLLNSRMAELHLSPNNLETYDALTAAARPHSSNP